MQRDPGRKQSMDSFYVIWVRLRCFLEEGEGMLDLGIFVMREMVEVWYGGRIAHGWDGGEEKCNKASGEEQVDDYIENLPSAPECKERERVRIEGGPTWSCALLVRRAAEKYG